VLGASVSSLTGLLSRQFVVLVVLANVISVPLAYIALTRWLQDFAFRIELGWDTFTMAGVAALICAVLPILMHSFLAARTDPVESLRYE
jgi:putative ABC transport system permease protein